MTTPTERYDMLLDKIEQIKGELKAAQDALFAEREAHRLTREAHEAYAASVGMIVVERDTAEERLKEVRQELEKVNPADLKKEILSQVTEVTAKAQEPLPRHENVKDDPRPAMVDRPKGRA